MAVVYETAIEHTAAFASYPNGIGHATCVNIFSAADLADGTGNVIRAYYTEGNYAVEITSCYIGYQAGSGDAYDFADTPTQITWNNGQSNLVLGATLGTEHASDMIEFDYDGTKTILIAWHKENASNNETPRATDPDVPIYYKSAVDEASVVNKSGFTSFDSTRIYGWALIEYATADLSAGGGDVKWSAATPWGSGVEGFSGNKWSY